MKNTAIHERKMGNPRGQSLVETAIFLPIIVLLLVGVVEVSNLAVTQNRVSYASRVATGFAAANFKADDWADAGDETGWPAKVAVVARNNVTETLDLDPNRWDIYVVKATLDDSANYSQWDSYRAWGNEQVVEQATWDSMEAEIQTDVKNAMDDQSIVSAEGLEVVSTVAFHNRRSILRLDYFNPGAFVRVRGLTVMRVKDPAPYRGCPLLPIAVRFNQYSAYPSNWPTDPVTRYLHKDDGSPVYPGDPANQVFPQGTGPNGGFEYPNPPPVYVNNLTAPNLHTDTFQNNIPGVPLADAKPGYIYWAREEANSGGFGWLSWTGSTAATCNRPEGLCASLMPPGNFQALYPGSDADMGTMDTGGNGASGNGDGILDSGEWVHGYSGNVSSVEPVVENYIRVGTPVTLIVYDLSNNHGGSNAAYRVRAFEKVKLIGGSFQGSSSSQNENKWMVIEHVGWGLDCD